MATGALDANGIWQYGEDDSETTFSALLNKLGGSTSTTVTRLEEMGGITSTQAATARENLRVGLVPISPSSVVIATGSGSANTLGQVSFTGATSVSLNGVFASDYRNYKILFRATPASGSVVITWRSRTSGTDYSGAGYNYTGYQSTSTGLANVYTIGGTGASAVIGYGSVSSLVSMEITNPQTTQITNFTLASNGHNGSGNGSLHYSGNINVNNQFDGITFYAQSSTITGEIQVFGYND